MWLRNVSFLQGLTAETSDACVVPGTASSWKKSQGELVYTLSFRPEELWSNGEAEYLAARLKNKVNPATAST